MRDLSSGRGEWEFRDAIRGRSVPRFLVGVGVSPDTELARFDLLRRKGGRGRGNVDGTGIGIEIGHSW